MKSKIWKKGLFVLLGILLLFVLFIIGDGIFSPIPFRQLDSFSGIVIDSDSKKPLTGAAVLAIYYHESYSIAGANLWATDGQETLTDENGKFYIPSKKRWFVLYRGYTQGKLIIFKPGYGVFPSHKFSKAVGVNKTWPPPEKSVVYKLPKLSTKEERKANMYFNDFYDLPHQKIINFLNILNEEYKYLGIRPYSIKEQEK
ncbi:MAG: hypothetical protein JW932_13095 [Deltaproteobacteria bacterium]|nr:hypothetical protein [Deltaproteobacteria bacterium]